MAEIDDLMLLRKKCVLADSAADAPVPRYWESEVPPGVKTAQDFLNQFGSISEEEAEAFLLANVGKTTSNRWGQTVPVLAITTSEPWENYVVTVRDPLTNEEVQVAREGARHRFETTIGGGANSQSNWYNRINPVSEIEVMESSAIYETEGFIARLPSKVFIAHGTPYPNGEDAEGNVVMTNDSCRSGPERAVPDGASYKWVGAATALLARLLEPACG